MRKNILITGLPHSGKSTLLKSVLAKISGEKVGFVTNEIVAGGVRVGFRIETCLGSKTDLAHVNFSTGIRVSRYGINIGGIIAIIPEVERFEIGNLLYLDEIGEMQLFSQDFRDLVEKYIFSPNIFVATISKVYSSGFMERLKAREDVVIVEITPDNREEKEKFVRELIGKIRKAKRYMTEPGRFSVKGGIAKVQGDHAERRLFLMDGEWSCSCDFFSKNKICSHVISLEGFLESR